MPDLQTDASQLPGLILAGGQARRMGGADKALLNLDGRSLLARVQARLAPQLGPLALSANGDPARFAGAGLPVLADALEDAGPLAGVLAGLDWAAGLGATALISVAADTPFFPRDLVARLLVSAQGQTPPLVLAATPGDEARSARDGLIRHPTFGLWPVALRDDLRAYLNAGGRKVVAWCDQHGARAARFDSDLAFFNLNTPQDMSQAATLLAADPKL